MGEVDYPREFTFFRKFGEAIGRLPRNLGDQLIVALIRYGAYGEDPGELPYPLDALFLLMRDDIGNSLSARARGKGGGRPPRAARRGPGCDDRKPEDANPDDPGASAVEAGDGDAAESEPEASVAEHPVVTGLVEPILPDSGKAQVATTSEPEVSIIGGSSNRSERDQEVSAIREPEVSKVTKPRVSRSAKPRVSEIAKPKVSETGKPKVSENEKPNTSQYSTSQYRETSIPQGVSGADRSKRTRAPTLEEMRDHCRSKGYAIDAAALWHRYDEAGWVDSDGRPIRDWRALCAACERNGASPGRREEARSYAEYNRA